MADSMSKEYVPYDPLIDAINIICRKDAIVSRDFRALHESGGLIILYPFPAKVGSLHVSDDGMDLFYYHVERLKKIDDNTRKRS